jgi:hypothetical protein
MVCTQTQASSVQLRSLCIQETCEGIRRKERQHVNHFPPMKETFHSQIPTNRPEDF